jgi:hypothetical protein
LEPCLPFYYDKLFKALLTIVCVPFASLLCPDNWKDLETILSVRRMSLSLPGNMEAFETFLYVQCVITPFLLGASETTVRVPRYCTCTLRPDN